MNVSKKSSKKSSDSDDSTSKSSSNSSCDDEAKMRDKLKKIKKKIKREERRAEKRLKKKLKKEKKKLKKAKKKEKDQRRTEPEQIAQETVQVEKSSNIPISLMEKSKAMAPMTKEEWEKKQSVVRKVYDEETGRYRIIKGDGEVLEEMVSMKRHKEINKQATQADGEYFQAVLNHK